MSLPAAARERPRYGGTLQVRARAAMERPQPRTGEWNRWAGQVFETLVRLDERGRPEPLLAVSWQSDAAVRQWRLRLRPSVRLHDGSTLTPEMAAQSLAANPAWRVQASGDSIVIHSQEPVPDLPAELARDQHAIAVERDGAPVGTGPFRVAEWEAARRLVLAAHEDHWAGRPFLDAVAVEMGRSLREQMIELELGRADLVEIAPGEVRRARQRGLRVWVSEPVELAALRFSRERAAVEDQELRRRLSRSVDRDAIHQFLLQKLGQPAASLLPQWLSGYAFLFSTARDIAGSAGPRTKQPLTLGYEASDVLAREIADRIALNAREAGIAVRPMAAGDSDMRLVRLRTDSPAPDQALKEAAQALGMPAPLLRFPVAAESLYEAERALLDNTWVAPLVHVPGIHGIGSRVRNWAAAPAFRRDQWRLEQVWLDPEREGR